MNRKPLIATALFAALSLGGLLALSSQGGQTVLNAEGEWQGRWTSLNPNGTLESSLDSGMWRTIKNAAHTHDAVRASSDDESEPRGQRLRLR